MTHPDHIRCDKCVFWIPYDGNPMREGYCNLEPCVQAKSADDFCRHYRDTWHANNPEMVAVVKRLWQMCFHLHRPLDDTQVDAGLNALREDVRKVLQKYGEDVRC